MELIKLLSGIGQVFTNPTVIVSIFFGIILAYIIFKLIDVFMSKIDDFNKILQQIIGQIKELTTIISMIKDDMYTMESDIKELWRKKEDK